MGLIVTIIIGAASVGIILGGLSIIKGQIAGSVENEKAAIKAQIAEMDQKLTALEKTSTKYVSKLQIRFSKTKRQALSTEIEKNNLNLAEFEKKLEHAQRAVVAREERQQELKSSKEGEHSKLEELASLHETLGSESMGLERQLADSMKQLDSLQNEVGLTEKQKEGFQKLSDVLSMAGERLRELITEYDTINTRLIEIRQQYTDLEGEYTRLVEQQLSGL